MDAQDLGEPGGGIYINFAGFGEEDDMLARAAYGQGYERLRQVKATYDPENLFCVNQNITPAGSDETTPLTPSGFAHSEEEDATAG